jgi:hypothetical protein
MAAVDIVSPLRASDSWVGFPAQVSESMTTGQPVVRVVV